ncbi:MAG: hypothetical protein K940chlam5_00832 [Candidatus Anoxychlamydiales bacterium]|nr:hypothetical protein [Candidatus Anoxychlamydiales bacterium]
MSAAANVQLTKSNLPIIGSKNINQNALPQDVVKTVGRVRLHVIDVFAKISAFFNILKNWLFGNSKSFKDDYEKLVLETSYAKKLKLYSDKKLNPDEKAFLTLLGQKISSFEDLEGLKGKIKKDQNVFRLFKAIASKASKEDIEKLLRKVKAKAPKNYRLVLEAANRLAKDLKASDEIKNLLNSKQQKVEANPDMRSEYKKTSTKKAMLPRKKETTSKAEGLTTKKKILVGGAAIAVAVGIAAGVYYTYTAPGSVVEPIVNAISGSELIVNATSCSPSVEAGKQAMGTYGSFVGGLLKKSIER